MINTRTQRKITDVVLSPNDDPMLADHPTGVAANPTTDEVY